MRSVPEHRPRSRLRVADLLGEVATGIARSLGRSVLTAMGSVLGVGTLVATVGFVTTSSRQVSELFDAQRATQVVVQDPSPVEAEPGFPEDAAERLESLNGVVHAGLTWTVPEAAMSARPGGGAGSLRMPVIAAEPGAVRAMGAHVVAGRAFDGFHERSGAAVAMLSSGAAERLAVTRVEVGPTIFVEGRPFTVIGIFDEVARNTEALQGIIVPTAAAEALPGQATGLSMLVEVAPGAGEVIAAQAPVALRPDDPERLEALAPPDPGELRRHVEGDLETVLIAVSLTSLAAGAVTIMNTSLVSVMERSAEIGLRRALGARPVHIVAQVLAETGMLGAVGGVIGSSLGILVLVGVAAARGWSPSIDPYVPLTAPLAGMLAGVLAGLLPARRAIRLDPTEVLRR